jgi:diguanylate cyclase (GGDEF)-like protein
VRDYRDMTGAVSADLRTMRRAATITLYCGAALGVVGVFVTERTDTGRLAMAGGCLAFLILAIVLTVTSPGPRVVEATALAATVILGGVIALSRPIGLMPMYYLWPVIFAAYFCSTRSLVLAFAVMLGSLGAGLALNPTVGMKFDLFIGAAANVGLVAVLVAVMTGRESRLRADLEVAAHTDPLTALLNRRAFNPQLEELIVGASTDGQPLSVVMFDIDHFKDFNDRNGHVAGDDALCRVAMVLRARAKRGDLVSRYGGEEFAVALPGADASDARSYADSVARALHAGTARSDRPLSVSAGIATLSADLRDIDALISRADDALYAAKRAGRARSAWWDGTLCVGTPIESAIRAA